MGDLVYRVLSITLLGLAVGCHPGPGGAGPGESTSREPHLADLTQITRGGENAEAYFSSDGDELVFQSRPQEDQASPLTCDRLYKVAAGGGTPRAVSSGKGRVTCGFFFPGDRRILFSSTHHVSEACPPPPDRSRGYVWPLYDYDIYAARPDGSELTRLAGGPGYDAEATVCSRDGSVVFTSTRDGDLDLYRMDADGGHVSRLTSAPGYDGGAFFSPDCSKIVWRASRPAPGPELDDYRALLASRLVRPGTLELWVANADGSDARQVTYLGAASFAPSFFPSGDRIVFSSNVGAPGGREFDLWAIDVDGTDLTRITDSPGFDGFPMFSPDGKRLVFSSNRGGKRPGETNVFVARWVDTPVRSAPRAEDRFLSDAAWLADDRREGRGVGTKGLDAAARWIAARFRTLGLAPGLGAGGYEQRFEVKVAVKRGDATGLAIGGRDLPAAAFEPLGFSADGTVTAATALAGHGITASELGVDEYAGRDVRGKVVVVRRYVPGGTRFAGDDAQRRYGDLRYKAWNAREHGAAALVIVDAPPARPAAHGPHGAASPESLPRLAVEPFGDVGIPVVVVSAQAGAPLLLGHHRARVAVKLVTEKHPAYNVIARIPAGSPGRRPGAVVLGAHYDHLGWGGRGSLYQDAPAIHNGADDNASGTAALLEAARILSARRSELASDVWFVAFSAEERGAIGSTTLTRSPPPGLDLQNVRAMINMDMVGRLRDGALAVVGTESAAEWPEIVAPLCARLGLRCTLGGGGYGPSDHTPFYAAGVPVLHLFTGVHPQYHKPSDDVGLLNAAGGARIAELASELVLAVAGRKTPLTYRASVTPLPTGDLRARGASLGTVPDYAGPPGSEPGVLLAGVRPGGPADKAGIRRGDRLVRLGEHDVRNVEDFTFALRAGEPGATTTVVIVRDGVRHEIPVTLGEPRR